MRLAMGIQCSFGIALQGDHSLASKGLSAVQFREGLMSCIRQGSFLILKWQSLVGQYWCVCDRNFLVYLMRYKRPPNAV